MRVVLGICLVGLAAGVVGVIRTFSQGLIVTNMTERVPWGLDVAAYIFCTGLSAGSFVVSALGLFGFKQFKPVSRLAVIQAIILLLIAPIFLLVAMGRPERFYLIYLSPNVTSVISWGAYLLVVYPTICVIYAYYLMKRDMVKTPLPRAVIERHDRLARFWGLVGVPAAILVHGYTGVLLGFVKGRVLWHTALMPVLFLTSAIVSGIALLIIVLVLLNATAGHKTEKPLIGALAKLMFAVLLVDVFFLTCEVLTSTYGRGGEHFAAWRVLISGSYAWLFLGGEIFVGVVIPIVLLTRWRDNIMSVVTAAALIMIGVFAMRCNLILGGQVIQPYGGPLGSYFPSLDEWLILLGLFSLGGVLYMAGAKFLPLMPTTATAAAAAASDD